MIHNLRSQGRESYGTANNNNILTNDRRSKRATKASQKKQAIEKEVEIKRKAKGTQHKK